MPFPRVSAIAIAFFLGFVVPFVVYMLLGSLLMPEKSEDAPHLFALIIISWAVFALVPPVGAGYLAARIAKVQPLLHGCIVGVLGSILVAVMATPASAGLWSAFIFVPGGIVGGWVWKAQSAKGAP